MEISLNESDLHTNNINLLPDELLTSILKLLDIKSKIASELVCQRWVKLSKSTDVWSNLKHYILDADGYNPGKLTGILSRAGRFLNSFEIHLRIGSEGNLPLLSDLGSIYENSPSGGGLSDFLPKLTIFYLLAQKIYATCSKDIPILNRKVEIKRAIQRKRLQVWRVR